MLIFHFKSLIIEIILSSINIFAVSTEFPLRFIDIFFLIYMYNTAY